MSRRRSIRNKLAIALWGVAIIVFVVAGLVLALFENLTLERRARQIMEPYAQLVSVGTEAAVAFEDPGRAQEILNTLKTNPQISEAEILLRDGRLLARYCRSKGTFLPPSLKPDGVYLNHNSAELMQSLQDGAHLRLVMSLNELNRQTRNIVCEFAVGVLVLLVTISLGLRAALQKTIISPISTLVMTVEQVRTEADYGGRVPASDVDEVARLGQSFNAMMGVIQEREDDLRRLTLFQRAILDNAAYGIVSTTTDGIVSSFNRAAERLLGYTAGEVVGKLTPVCWHDQEEIAHRARQLSEELGETVAPGFDVFAARLRRNLSEEHEWTYIRKDGTRVPMFLSVTALRDESGQVTGLVGLIYDITERKRTETELHNYRVHLELLVQDRTAELERANVRLQEMDRLKSMFIASTSHELRTPLNAIIGFTGMTIQGLSGPLNEEQRDNLARVYQSAKHLLALITDIIDISKIEAGKIGSFTEEFPLKELVDEAIDTVTPQLQEKGLPLEREIPAGLMVYADRKRLLQCLVNLLSNAAKFTEKGRIVVAARESEGRLELSVTDSGVGIAERDLPRLFKPFERLESRLRIQAGGTGLGLYLTSKLVADILCGTIAVVSREGEGSTFTLSLPRDVRSVAEPPDQGGEGGGNR
jgi:PAS domain S-box-containing protein